MHNVPVLEVGGTHVSAALVDAVNWQVVEGTEKRFHVDSLGSPEEIVGVFLDAAATVPPERAGAWGIAMPDPFDYPRGIALFEGVGKFDSLNGVNIRDALLAGITPTPADVRFLNDAEAFLLGEWVAGAARGVNRCAAVTLGTGVGSAFLADGEIVNSGPHVPRDGRVHRLTIGGEPLEDIMSRRALRRDYARATGDAHADVRQIADRARGGDYAAQHVLANALEKLGTALVPWFASFGAEVVVVGGSMSGAWDILETPFRNGLSTGGSQPRLVLARDQAHAALIGAAHYAIN